MFRMKNLIYFAFIGLLLTSCSEYQKVLNKGTVEQQYAIATKQCTKLRSTTKL